MTRSQFDLIVVGGGINGCAIASLAAQAGAACALLEKGDFASGTSSRSTKLLHGGLRYLEHFEIGLVRESLKERFIQWQAAPHLVRPMGFVVPVYRGDSRPLWMMTLGVWFYDLLSGRYRVGRPWRRLSAAEVAALAPGINRDGLTGGVEYFDSQMDDARICLENALMARQKGASTANYTEVEEFIKDGHQQTVGVRTKDVLTGERKEWFAGRIIVAGGPWSDELRHKDVPGALKRLRPTKGVHIVYRGEISSSAFLLQSRRDKRVFFVIPFKGNSLIGTTDTDYDQSPDAVAADNNDIEYLLQEAGRVFPNITFEPSKIITTFAGIRPLVSERGEASRVSRKHSIEQSSSGVYYVMGGKYTTYRLIAEETLLKAMPHLAPHIPYEGDFALYGSGAGNEEHRIVSQRFDVSLDVVRHLHGVYGSRFEDVLALVRQEEKLKERICSCSPAIAGQVVYARDVEMARTVEDVVERRLGLGLLDCPTKNCRRVIEHVMGH